MVLLQGISHTKMKAASVFTAHKRIFMWTVAVHKAKFIRDVKDGNLL